MDISDKLNTKVQFKDLFEMLSLQNLLENAVQVLDFKHPTKIQKKALETITPSKKLLKKQKKARRKSSEIEEEEEKQEEQSEQQKNAKQFIIQSGVQSGKSTVMALQTINNFYANIEKFDPKQLQKDQDEATHGLFSVILCSSKEHCQKISVICDNLLMRFSKNERKKLTKESQELNELTQTEKNIKAGIQVYNLALLEKEQNPSIMPNKHYILVATPSQFLKFAKTMKIEQKYYVNFGIDDLDYMLSFGYATEIDNLQFHFQSELLTNQVIVTISSRIEEDLKECQEKIVQYGQVIECGFEEEQKKDEENEEVKKTMQSLERDYRIVSQFYHIGDEVSKYINMYILYKLQFLNGKSIIVCPDLMTVYKVYLFLSRIGAKHFQVLNEEDPKNLRYYVLSMFNTGVISTMITTEKVFDDLKKGTFYSKKRKILNFKNLGNIILMDLAKVKGIYNDLYKYFRGSEGTIINLVSQSEEQIEILTKIITEQKKTHTQVNIKEFPLKKQEIEAFRYRISDVVTAISRKQTNNMKMLDFKKKLLKSKDLQQYFEQNLPDRQMLVEDINTLSKQIHTYQIKCDEEIPEYLVPQIVKEQRKKIESQTGQEGKFSKIKVAGTNEDFQKSLKRRMEKNNLTLSDVKKKKVLDQVGDKYVYVDNKKEEVEGDQVDPSKLKVISGRKVWKQKHGFKLKKRNRRLEKKGVFNN